MTTATAKAPKTIEFFKEKLEKLRKRHNRILEDNKRKERAHPGGDWRKKDIALLRKIKHNDVERDLVLVEVHDAGLKEHILDRTITFQASYDYPDGNHGLGDALEKQFPQGRNDSESGQGFFYINQKFAEAVVEWLKDKVLVEERVPKNAVDQVKVRVRCVGVHDTASPMLK
jgi:hypothetical protein